MPGKITRLVGTIKRKPATAPDGRDDRENGTTEKTSIMHDLTHNVNLKHAATLGQGLTTLASGEPMDDKELLLENGVAMLQSLPLNSGLSSATSDAFIKM